MSATGERLYYHIRKKILSWYNKEKRHLPWRNTKNPYHILLSEFILQQTRVEQGLQYYHKILKHFPTIIHLAETEDKQLLKLWEGLGYYNRALHLLKTAKIITNQYRGNIPQNYSELIQLPGIGNYTASMILSICFNKPYPAIDGNVKRIFARMEKIEALKESKAFDTVVHERATKLISKKCPGDFNQALMDLGATICTPEKPKCEICPVQKFCLAHKENAVHKYPKRKTNKKIPEYHSIVIFIKQKNNIIAYREQKSKFLNNLYALPWTNIKTSHINGQTPKEIYPLLEKINLPLISKWQHRFTLTRRYSSKIIHFHVYTPVTPIRIKSQKLSHPYEWIEVEKIKELPFSKAFDKILQELDVLSS